MDTPSKSLSFFHGLSTIPRALSVLSHVPHVLRLLLIPLFLTVILDGMALYYGYGWLHGLILRFLPEKGVAALLLNILAGGVVLLTLAWTFGFVYLTLCELVIDRVSEEIEEHLTGQRGSVEGLSHSVRGLFVSLLQSMVLAGLGLLGALLNLIPLLGSILSLLLAATLLGYGFFVVSAGRKGLHLGERIALSREHLWALVGLGGCAFVINIIPLINLLALPVFVVAGTILFLDATPPPPPDKAALPAAEAPVLR